MTSDFYNGALYILHLEALRNFYFWDRLYRKTNNKEMKTKARLNRDKAFFRLLDGRKDWR